MTWKSPLTPRHTFHAFDMETDDEDTDGFGRMTLSDAVAKLLPTILKLNQPTLRDIEKATGLAERKARWHIGQLVKAGHLVRCGMGRGTHYVSPARAKETLEGLLPVILALETPTMSRIGRATALTARATQWYVAQLIKGGHLVAQGSGRGTLYVRPVSEVA